MITNTMGRLVPALLFLSVSLSLVLIANSYERDYAVPDDLVQEITVEKRDLPSDVFPELLIVVDMSLRKKIGGTDDDVRTYIRRFVANIQRVYDSIPQPRFHFRIADIYICRSEADCQYISKNQHGEKLEVDDSNLLDDMKAWANAKKSSIKFDLMMTFTSLEMCRTVYHAEGTCPRGVGLAGKAFLGGACGESNVGIATDNGGYSGIKTVAHEMAHLFGAEHDGVGSAAACSGSDGYIMGGSSVPQNRYRASPCTIKSIAKTVLSSKVACLRDDSRGKYQLDSTLPGSITSTDDQCRQKYGPQSKNCPFGGLNTDVCTSHWCFYPKTGTCRSGGSAFSGTPCDNKDPNKRCFMSYGCVSKDFQVPKVNVDLSGISGDSGAGRPSVTRPPISVTTPRDDPNCQDAHRTHLKITAGGKMTDCAENYRLYPGVFCSISWVRDYCCATARANCKNSPNDVIG